MIRVCIGIYDILLSSSWARLNVVLMSKYNEYQKYLAQQGRTLPKKIPAKPGQFQAKPLEDEKVAPLKIRLSARKRRKNDDSDDQRNQILIALLTPSFSR